MSGRCSVYIEAPVATVFDFYRDPARGWEWLARERSGNGVELLDAQVTPDGVGTSYRWAMTLPGKRLEGVDVYTEFVENERITETSSSAFVGTWTYTFEPDGSGTRVTARRHPASSRLQRAVDRLVDRFRDGVERQEMQTLKAVLENTDGSGPWPLGAGRPARQRG